jgi:hypothetical protein
MRWNLSILLSLYAQYRSVPRAQACRDVVELVWTNLRFAELEMRKAFVEILNHALACLIDLLGTVAPLCRCAKVVLLLLALDQHFNFDVLPERLACGIAKWLAMFHCTVMVRFVGGVGGPVVPVDPPAVFDGPDSTLDGDQNVVAVEGIWFRFVLALLSATYTALLYVTVWPPV